MYHIQYNNNFETNKSISMAYRRSFDGHKLKAPNGRPQDTLRAEAFMKVIKYFNDNDDEQITIADLGRKLTGVINGVTPYIEKYMRMKLGHFGGNIIDTHIQEKRNIVTHISNCRKDRWEFLYVIKRKR